MVTIKQKLIPAGTNARSGYSLKPEFLFNSYHIITPFVHFEICTL